MDIIDLNPLPSIDASNPATAQDIVKLVFTIIGSIAVIVILILAFKYMTSRGSPEATGKLRDGMIFAALGLVVIVAAGSIISFVIGRLQ